MNSTELATAVLNTLSILLLCIAMAVPLGTAMALLLQRTQILGRRLAWVILSSQIAVPLYVFAGGWSASFGSQGWLTFLRLQNGSTAGNTGFSSSLAAILTVSAIHALAAIPWVVLVISLGLRWTHRGQEEQAMLDGGFWNLLTRSILARLYIWIGVAAVWCAIPVVTEMVVSNLYQVSTVTELIYLDASRGTLTPWTYIACWGFSVGPLGLLIAGVGVRYWNWQQTHQKSSHFFAAPVELGRWRGILSGLVWTVVIAIVGLPILGLCIKAGWEPRIPESGIPEYGWSLNRFGTTCRESVLLFSSEFQWSGLLALVSSSLALAGAVFLYSMAKGGWRTCVSIGMALLIAVPGPMVGMLVIAGLNRSWPVWLGALYDRTLAAPVIAQQFRLLPIAWLLVYAIVSNVSESTWEQAKLDGLSRWQRWRFVLWPQTAGFWMVGWLLLAVLSVGELSCSLLVLPPGVTTVSMRLFEMLHFGMRHQDSGLCGVLILLGWAVAVVFWKTLSDRQQD